MVLRHDAVVHQDHHAIGERVEKARHRGTITPAHAAGRPRTMRGTRAAARARGSGCRRRTNFPTHRGRGSAGRSRSPRSAPRIVAKVRRNRKPSARRRSPPRHRAADEHRRVAAGARLADRQDEGARTTWSATLASCELPGARHPSPVTSIAPLGRHAAGRQLDRRQQSAEGPVQPRGERARRARLALPRGSVPSSSASPIQRSQSSASAARQPDRSIASCRATRPSSWVNAPSNRPRSGRGIGRVAARPPRHRRRTASPGTAPGR